MSKITINGAEFDAANVTMTVDGGRVKWFDEVSEINYEAATERKPARRADFSGSFTVDMTAEDAQLLFDAVEPPGLAANRRARERWVGGRRENPSAWAERHVERMLGYWAPLNADAPEGYWSRHAP